MNEWTSLSPSVKWVLSHKCVLGCMRGYSLLVRAQCWAESKHAIYNSYCTHCLCKSRVTGSCLIALLEPQYFSTSSLLFFPSKCSEYC